MTRTAEPVRCDYERTVSTVPRAAGATSLRLGRDAYEGLLQKNAEDVKGEIVLAERSREG